MIKELIALLDGRETGRVVRDNRGKLTFIYNEQWRNAADAYPLSLSMPITLAEHPNAKIDPFLWGLLPDNEIILGNWARKFHVSARNAFSLIAYVGEDCAGAVQFVQPARLNAILGAAAPPIEWLDEKEIAKRLRALREDHSAWRLPRDTGQFSLAGAQPKTALLFEDNKWGVPAGRVPTTHIFKPPSGDFDGHAENEHFCLELGRALDLPVVERCTSSLSLCQQITMSLISPCLKAGALRLRLVGPYRPAAEAAWSSSCAARPTSATPKNNNGAFVPASIPP